LDLENSQAPSDVTAFRLTIPIPESEGDNARAN
jgi:hypothetical protein